MSTPDGLQRAGDAQPAHGREARTSAEDDRPASVPASIRRPAEHAVGSTPVPEKVQIEQEGEMWTRPGARGMRFRATQTFAVERVAFEWRARFRVGPLTLRVIDRFADDEGELAVRLFGIHVQRQRGPEVADGEALRYLAELPWVPHALLANRELEWRELVEGRVEVATRVRGRRLAVELERDGHGDIVRATSRMRRRKAGKEWVEIPWGGEFDHYERLGGLRVPLSVEAFWDPPTGREVYFRARVTSVEPLAEPAPH